MQVFRFWVYVVKDGDELEKVCLQYSMKRALAKYDSWFAKFVNKIHDLLWWKKHFPGGIRDCIAWTGDGAKKMQKALKKELWSKEAKHYLEMTLISERIMN